MMGLTKSDMLNKCLLLVDLLGIFLSFLFTGWIIYGQILKYWITGIYGMAFIVIFILYVVIFFLFDTFSTLFRRGLLEEMIAVIKINSILTISLIVFMFLFRDGASYSRLFLLTFLFLNVFITYILRQYYKILFLALYKKSKSSNKIMIITTSDQINKILDRFKNANEWEYEITYLTVLDQSLIGQKVDGIEIKADMSNMYEVARKEVLDGVFIYLPYDNAINWNLEEMILKIQNMGITVDLSIHTFGLHIQEKVVRQMSGYHVMTFSTRLYNEGQLFLKRLTDIFGGFVGCLITIILMIFVAPAIWIESPGPVFFSQVRVGKNGRRFRIYKFRSMYMNAEERLPDLMKHNEMNGFMFKMKNDPRITKVGNFLRKTSIDEFPQFFNVLKGDMSLVGTRPPTEKEFLQYEGRHKRRLTLKSGVTGLWQVSGRSNITEFEDIVKMDLEYIDNWSLGLDLKILIKTVWVVFFAKGSR